MTLKAQLAEGALLGSFLCLSDPSMPALFARAGFDLVVVDTEHFLLNPQTVQTMIVCARAAGIRCLVRPAEISRGAIQRALDAGPDGILVPLVNSREDAERVVEFSRYAPVGARGFHGLTPATHWGRTSSSEHVATDGERTFVAVQIETPAGVAACQMIAGVEGIDMLFVGPGDLSQAMGYMSEYENARVLGAIEEVLVAARARERLSGIYAARPNLETLARKHDARLILRGSDTRFFLEGARQALKEPPR